MKKNLEKTVSEARVELGHAHKNSAAFVAKERSEFFRKVAQKVLAGSRDPICMAYMGSACPSAVYGATAINSVSGDSTAIGDVDPVAGDYVIVTANLDDDSGWLFGDDWEDHYSYGVEYDYTLPEMACDSIVRGSVTVTHAADVTIDAESGGFQTYAALITTLPDGTATPEMFESMPKRVMTGGSDNGMESEQATLLWRLEADAGTRPKVFLTNIAHVWAKNGMSRCYLHVNVPLIHYTVDPID